MTTIYLKATRAFDNRMLFVQSNLNSEDDWINVIDCLVEADFTLTSITRDEYYIAIARKQFCYLIEDHDYESFISFIKDNHLSFAELREKLFKKHEEKK